MFHRIKSYLFVLTAQVLLWIARHLWRVQVFQHPGDEVPHLYAHWHGDELLLVPVFSRRGYAVMASRSRDGESMALLLSRLGYFVVRGSSSRGGAGGLKGLVDAVCTDRRSAAIAVDGPRGPIYEVKPGILFLAQNSGLPIVPAAGFAVDRWPIPRAWNEGYLPKPFSRCVVLFGEPMKVPADCSEEKRKALQDELKGRLLKLRAEAREIATQASATATKSSKLSSSNP